MRRTGDIGRVAPAMRIRCSTGAMLLMASVGSVGVRLSRDAGLSDPGAQSLSAVVLPVAPPDQAGGAVAAVLDQGAEDRLRQGRVVEPDAQVGLVRRPAGPAPGGADL